MSARLAALFAGRPGPGPGSPRPLVIAYLTAGYPGAEETVELLLALEAGGADAVELGLPFSDPLADGPVIQAASQAALAAGIDHPRILELVAAFRRRSQIPLVLMGYANPIFAFGPGRFFREAAAAGADGLIVPDLPPEEAGEFLPEIRTAGLDWIPLAAPTSSEVRLRVIDGQAGAFVYCVAVTGVTGVRADLPEDLRQTLERAERVLTRPFVAGFGFSRPEQIRRVSPPAAGVVVGSALLARIGAEPTASGRRRVARTFMEELRAG